MSVISNLRKKTERQERIRTATLLKEGFFKDPMGEIVYIIPVDRRKAYDNARSDYDREQKVYEKKHKEWEDKELKKYEDLREKYDKSLGDWFKLPYELRYNVNDKGELLYPRPEPPPYPKSPLAPQTPDEKWRKVVIHVDLKERRVLYIDENGKQKIHLLVGFRPLEDSDIVSGLEAIIPDARYNVSSDLLKTEWMNHALTDIEKADSRYDRYNDPEKQYDPYNIPYWAYSVAPSVKAYVDGEAERRRMAIANPFSVTVYDRIPISKIFGEDVSLWFLAQEYSDQYHTIADKLDKRRESYMLVTPEDCPEIPNLKKGVEFFPHQALSLSVLDKNPACLIDVAMGGGKSLTLLSDILNLIQKGKVQRPLIVMPNQTLGQQKAEFENFTGNRVNVVVINSDTMRRLGGGEEEAAFQWVEDFAFGNKKEDIPPAPPNTIYFTSYEWLRKVQYVETGETNSKGKPLVEPVCPHAQWLIDGLKIDYVALDESHKIKSEGSATAIAASYLAAAPYRRIASGTVIPNNPTDLLMQTRFLDPNMFGTEREFKSEYADTIGSRGKVTKWRQGALKAIRKKIIESGGVSVRRTYWMHLLPPRHEKVHIVKLTKAQQAEYERLIHDIMTEVMNDPKLVAAMTAAADDDENTNFFSILTKLNRVDAFLCAPGDVSGALGRLGPEDQISPKAIKINEILRHHFSEASQESYEAYVKRVKESGAVPKDKKYWDEHIAGPGKVLVFVQERVSAKHLVENLDAEFRDAALYYSATDARENLERFKTEAEIKILVAVDDSLREGQNLQMVNRVIRADMNWNPGDNEQSYARAWRPKQERAVHIDIILCDDTFDVAKFARVVSKYHIQRKIDSDFDDDTELEIISMHPNVVWNFRKASLLAPYVERLKSIHDSERRESETIRQKYGFEMINRRKPGIIKDSYVVLTPTYSSSNGKAILPPVYELFYEKGEKSGKRTLVITDADSVNILDVGVAKKLGFRWSDQKEEWWMLWPTSFDRIKMDALNEGYRLRSIDKKVKLKEFEIEEGEIEHITDTIVKKIKPTVVEPEPDDVSDNEEDVRKPEEPKKTPPDLGKNPNKSDEQKQSEEFTNAQIRITYYAKPGMSGVSYGVVHVFGQTFDAKEVIKAYRTSDNGRFRWNVDETGKVIDSKAWSLYIPITSNLGNPLEAAERSAFAIRDNLRNSNEAGGFQIVALRTSQQDPFGQLKAKSTQKQEPGVITDSVRDLAKSVLANEWEFVGYANDTEDVVATGVLIKTLERRKLKDYSQITKVHISDTLEELEAEGIIKRKSVAKKKDEATSLPTTPVDKSDNDTKPPVRTGPAKKIVQPVEEPKDDRLPVWAGIEDRDDVLYFILDAVDDGAPRLSGVKGLRKRPGYYFFPLTDKAHAIRTLNKIKEKANLAIKDEAAIVEDIGRTKRLKGKRGEVVLSPRKKEQKADGTIELHFGTLNGEMHFIVWWNEAVTELRQLSTKIGFSEQGPFYEHEIKGGSFSDLKKMLDASVDAKVYFSNFVEKFGFAQAVEEEWGAQAKTFRDDYVALAPPVKKKKVKKSQEGL